MGAALEGVEGHATVPDRTWRRANVVCALFYLLLGVANLVVAFNTTEDIWVKSKLVFIAVLFVFTFAQFFWIMRQQPQPPSAQA
jgi:intracellular septation protein